MRSGWFVAMGFFQSAVILARQVDVALSYVVEHAPAARTTRTAGVAGAAEEAPAGDTVLVLRDLVVNGIGIAPTLARLLIYERLHGRHGRRGNRGSAKPSPAARGAAAGGRAIRGIGGVGPANYFVVSPNPVGGKHRNVGNIAHAIGGHAIGGLPRGLRIALAPWD